MPPVFILTRQEADFLSLSRFIESRNGHLPVRIHVPARNPRLAHNETDIICGYRQVVDQIEAWRSEHGNGTALRNGLAFVDLDDERLNDIQKLNPMWKLYSTWTVITSMLVLSYPELHWVFISENVSEDPSFCGKAHIYRYAKDLDFIFGLIDKGFTPLFDGTKLRESIRRQMRNQENGAVAPHLPPRNFQAAAIDDEDQYAYFNAYCAYKFGFLTHVVCTERMMEEIFKNHANAGHRNEEIKLVFEDIYLNFADKPLDQHLSKLEVRDEEKNFPGLAKVKYRVFVTKGPEKPDDAYDQFNARYRERLKQLQGVWSEMLYKPLSGIFDLWRASGLEEEIRKREVGTFIWPPVFTPDQIDGRGAHHGVPGRMLAIAECLISRAEAILHVQTSVQDCIHGALLALEAAELLGNRTPMSTIEALSLKHEFEVSAECFFYGLQSNLDIDARLQEIENEVRWLAQRFYYKTRRVSGLETEINILNRLVFTLKENDRIDEEEACIRRLRTLRRRLWFARKRLWWKTKRERPAKNTDAANSQSFRWTRAKEQVRFALTSLAAPFAMAATGVVWFIRLYVETLLGSLKLLGWAITIWVLVLAGYYYYFSHPGLLSHKISHAVHHAVVNFISAHPPDELDALYRQHGYLAEIVVPIFIVLGFIHLGTLIAYLYSKISRK